MGVDGALGVGVAHAPVRALGQLLGHRVPRARRHVVEDGGLVGLERDAAAAGLDGAAQLRSGLVGDGVAVHVVHQVVVSARKHLAGLVGKRDVYGEGLIGVGDGAGAVGGHVLDHGELGGLDAGCVHGVRLDGGPVAHLHACGVVG